MKSRYCPSILLLAFMTAFPSTVVVSQLETEHLPSGQTIIERRPSKGPFHFLTLKLYSSLKDRSSDRSVAELLLTDPRGRRTGTDPIARVQYDQIPDSGYIEDNWEGSIKDLEVFQPLNGSYLARVTGIDTGSYKLYMHPIDEKAHSPNQPRFDNIPIEPGVIHAYTLDYTRTPGIPLKVIGGFDGGGERPRDVNTFLTYANPIAAQTTLRAGKTPFPLIIFYGAAIDPASFTATLNGANISRRFKPIPGRYQVVPLKFALGSNTLILSVQGKTAGGQVATDTDQFGFSVR